MVITQWPQEILGIENVLCSMVVSPCAVDLKKMIDPERQ
jgi:hypothetical protein